MNFTHKMGAKNHQLIAWDISKKYFFICIRVTAEGIERGQCMSLREGVQRLQDRIRILNCLVKHPCLYIEVGLYLFGYLLVFKGTNQYISKFYCS